MHPALEQHLQQSRVTIHDQVLMMHQIKDFNLAIDDYLGALAKEGYQDIPPHLAPYFASLWPSALALTNAIANLDLNARSVLEIGCGLAVPSMYALARGAHVTAIDIHPHVGELLRRNLAANLWDSDRLEYLCRDWRTSDCLGDQEFDFILASDVLYEEDHAQSLANAIHRHLKRSGTAIVVDPCRWHYQKFIATLKHHHFSVAENYSDYLEEGKKSRLVTIKATASVT